MSRNTDRLTEAQKRGLTGAQAMQAVAEGWTPEVQAAVASANGGTASPAQASPLSGFRERFPQYQNVSDTDLADALYEKFYSNMPRSEYDARLGLTTGDNPAAETTDRPKPTYRQYVDAARRADTAGDAPAAKRLLELSRQAQRAEVQTQSAEAGGDPIVVEGTDGQTFEFPAGTDRQTMQGALQRHYAASGDGKPKGRAVEEYTEEELKAAARRALADGNPAAAKRLTDLARAAGARQPVQPTATQEPERGLLHRLGDNLIGYDDGVMSAGEKLATALNIGGEGMTLGLIGDEAAAAADAAIGRGSYDERVQQYRGNEAQFRDENPLLAFGSEILPAFIPGAGLAKGIGAAKSVAGRVGTGILGGAAAGGTYGFMEGEGTDDRLEKGLVGGVLGGSLGLAMEPLARGARALYGKVGPGAAATARNVRSSMGLDDAGARMVAQAVERDMPYAADNLRRAGPNATNAQIGNNTKGLLDAVVNRPGAAGAASLARIEDMAATASRNFTRTLDEALGAPVGVARQQRQIMRNSAAGRREAYEAAYARPIDYSAPAARQLEDLLDRVPEEAIRKAEKLMRTEGATSRQIKATIGDDGRVVYERLPDVQQIDYITRALRDMGGFGMGEGASQGQAFASLARNLRQQLDELVPEYRGARAAGKDAIANREAAEFGESLLSPGTAMDVAEDTLADMTKGELRFVRQGLRDHVDEVMANTKAALTDQNMDAREALRPLKDMLSRAGQRKLRALMGDDEAGQLIAAGEEAFSALNLRASVATNSKTAPRLIAEGILDEAVPPTVGEAISEGRGILGAMSVIARPLLDDAAVQRAARKDGVMERVGQALLSPVQSAPQGGLLAQQLAPALRAGDAAQDAAQRRLRGLLSTLGATQGANLTR